MTAVEEKMAHIKRKIQKTESMIESLEKNREPKAKTVKDYEKDLERARRAFDVQQGTSSWIMRDNQPLNLMYYAIEKVRKASQARGLTLSDEDLRTYRDLSVKIRLSVWAL